MATPNVPRKSLMAYAAKDGSTWGTAVALGATDGMLVTSVDGLKPGRPYLPANNESDSPFPRTGDLGPRDPVNFTINAAARYDMGSLGILLGKIFGTVAAPAQQATTAAYLHEMQWADEVYGDFVTFAAERRNKIYEVPSAKVLGVTFSVSDGLVQMAYSLRGDECKDDSTVNQATQMDAVTYDHRHKRIRFVKESTFKINAESGGDLSGENALVVNDFTLEIARGADAEHAAGDENIIEPVDFSDITFRLAMSWPRQNAVNMAFLQNFDTEATQKVLIQFTGALIESTYYNDLKIYIPKMRVVDFDAPDSDEVLTANVELVAEEADSAPTGMSYTRPYIELINERTVQL